MPDPSERHGKDRWAPQPSRSQQRRTAIVDETKQPPGRKDRWTRCKAAKGAPHVPVIAFTGHPFHDADGCRWHPMWDSETRGFKAGWLCFHEERCQACGKVFRAGVRREECPDFAAAADGLAAAEAEAEAATGRYREWREQHGHRKPVITGPQGYRRKRSA